MALVRYTASASSKITKKLLSPKKKTKPLILPSQETFNKSVPKKKEATTVDRLDITSYNTELHKQFEAGDDLLHAIDTIVLSQWDRLDDGSISKTLREQIQRFRDSMPHVVSINEIYSIFPKNQTYVDRQLQQLINERKVRKIYVNSDENDIIIRNDEYVTQLIARFPSEDDVSGHGVANFLPFVQKDCSMYLTPQHIEENGFTRTDIFDLINAGFLTIMQEKGSITNYAITLPNLGMYTKLVVGARTWVIKLLKKQPWKEMLESQILERWNNNSFKLKNFKGYSLNWVLCEGIGSGDFEVFSTPAGRGWKVTGRS